MLTVSLSPSSLSAAKNTLGALCPNIKSSHRCEALARGLGFLSYAALRGKAYTASPSPVRSNGQAFYSYLAEHNFETEIRNLHVVTACMAVDAIARREPKLCVHGLGLGPPRHFPWEPPDVQQLLDARFLVLRKDLTSKKALEGFLLASAFLKRVPRTRSIRPEAGSYWIKHIAENYLATSPEGVPLGPRYVPNGILIAAALHAGFEMKIAHDEQGHLNQTTTFNMSVAALNALNDEFRPDSGRAQDRERRKSERRRR